MSITPLSALKVSKHHIPAHSLIPNCSIQRRPLLIYHCVFQPPVTASKIESHLSSIGVVVPQWRYTMYTTTHFHSTTHEVLCISHGRARLCFGGESNESRIEPVVEAGDVIIVPAGVGHRLLEELDTGFEMIGSYPEGKQWDMCYGKEGEEEKVEGISKLGWFIRDPIYGDENPTRDT